MKIDGVSKTERAYIKHITLTHEDVTYYVNLYWESGEGYQVVFTNADYNRIETPEWAVLWEDLSEGADSFAYTLDELTDMEIEG